jgi:hypothetical protein
MAAPLIWFDEDGTPLWTCNDCDRLVYLWDELCSPCAAAELT